MTSINAFVEKWSELGIVVGKPGPIDGSFPSVIHVETGYSVTDTPDTTKQANSAVTSEKK